MLKRLLIRNYAIIDEVEIDFSPRLNIITGETGAGKSIILGALGLIKGERAQMQMVRSADKKCTIEAVFDLSETNVSEWFQTAQLPFQKLTTVRRELSADGKTKAYINDTNCNLTQLQELGNQLVEIHSQHDSLELKSAEFQLEVVDAFADNAELKGKMSEAYTRFKAMQKEYQLLLQSQSKSQAEKDLQTYQLQELNQFDFEDWDQEQIENQHLLAENALEIKQVLSGSVQAMKHDEVNLLDSLKEILSRLRKFEKFSKELSEINEQMDTNLESMSTIVRDYEMLADNTDFDEEELVMLREKVEFIHKMLRKHQVTSLNELLALKQDLTTALNYGENLTEKIAEIEKSLAKLEKECLELAAQLSNRRKGVLSYIEQQLLDNLKELQMENSQFQIELISEENKLSAHGYDTVEFLFTANAGSPLRELKRAISGGEMSRFMLAIKSLIAQKIDLATLIFDEIDTGVSGTVANKVASVLDKLAKNHQIIAITHLPQIASRGSHHINVYKKTENNITQTHLKLLHQADREIEIARMISGESITQASLTSARELLK
ncbi:MAG: DNA repair protein RecN [Chitinophagales bacterium]|nr:DNA repair protein RecN [Chitinophagales bacterium]